MQRKTMIIIGVVVVLSLCCLGCFGVLAIRVINNPAFGSGLQQLTGSLRDMADLRSQLMTTYSIQTVEVRTVNGHILSISLTNSAFNNLASSEQEAKAKEVAQFVKDHYAEIKTIDTIQINLIEHTQVGIVYSNRFRTYNFDAATLSEK